MQEIAALIFVYKMGLPGYWGDERLSRVARSKLRIPGDLRNKAGEERNTVEYSDIIPGDPQVPTGGWHSNCKGSGRH